MSAEVEQKSHAKLYIFIWFLLALLTVVELFIPGSKTLSSFAKQSSLTALAIVKAGMVGWFFMHLNHETRWLKFIALIPISAAIYATVVCLESYFR